MMAITRYAIEADSPLKGRKKGAAVLRPYKGKNGMRRRGAEQLVQRGDG